MGVDDVAFHRRAFELDRPSPRSFAALLWELHQRRERSRREGATGRVIGWTQSLLGLKQYQRGFGKRHAEAARLAGRLACPAEAVEALAAVG